MTGNRAGGKKEGNGGNNDSQTDSDVPRSPQDLAPEWSKAVRR